MQPYVHSKRAHKLHGCDKDLKVSNIYCAVNQKKRRMERSGFWNSSAGDYIAQNGSIICAWL